MAASFTALNTDMVAAQAELATLATKVATDATAVAALTTTALAAEADNDRYARLRESLLGTLGQLGADASNLAARVIANQRTLIGDFKTLRGDNAITPASIPLHDIAGDRL